MLQVWEVVAVLSLVPGFMGGLDGIGTAVYLMHASKGTSTGRIKFDVLLFRIGIALQQQQPFLESIKAEKGYF